MKLPRRSLMPIIAVVLLLPIGLNAQQTRKSAAKFSAGSSVVIPLDIDNNIIRMKVRVNGSRELTMIFDTGADMTAIDEHFVKELGLKTTGDTLDGKGTGGNFTGSYIKRSTLSVDGAEVTNQPLAAFKIPKPPGFDFDGIIGYDFIAPFVVEIDYQKKTVTLSDPRAYVYRGKGVIIPLNFPGRKTPLVTTRLAFANVKPVTARLELDTGADNAFRLNEPFVRKHRLLTSSKELLEQARRGAGGEEQTFIGRAKTAAFGSIILKNVPVAFSMDKVGAGAATDNDGTLGGEVLRRFKVIIDYSRKRMMLERNTDFDQPYEDESGE